MDGWTDGCKDGQTDQQTNWKREEVWNVCCHESFISRIRKEFCKSVSNKKTSGSKELRRTRMNGDSAWNKGKHVFNAPEK